MRALATLSGRYTLPVLLAMASACSTREEQPAPAEVDAGSPLSYSDAQPDDAATDGEAPLDTAPSCAPAGTNALQVRAGQHFDDAHTSPDFLLGTGFAKACGVRFEAMFPRASSCGDATYEVCRDGTSPCPDNPSFHWNKLYGVGQLGGGSFGLYQYSSLRLGWRYRASSGMFELSPYLHDGCETDNGCGISLEVRKEKITPADGSYEPVAVAPNTWIPIELVYAGKSFSATIGAHSFRGTFDAQKSNAAQLFDTLYFGGTPAAPKDIRVYVRSVVATTSCS